MLQRKSVIVPSTRLIKIVCKNSLTHLYSIFNAVTSFTAFVSNHQQIECLFYIIFRVTTDITSNLCGTGWLWRGPLATSIFPTNYLRYLSYLCKHTITAISRIFLFILTNLPNCRFTIDCPLTGALWSIEHYLSQPNPLPAKLFRGNINIYLHFVSFLHIDMTQVVEIFSKVRQGSTYPTWSISWLLVSWCRKELGRQQQ